MAHLERPPVALAFSFDGVDDCVEVSPSPVVGYRSVSIEMLVSLSSENYGKDVLLLVSGQTVYNAYIEKYETEVFGFRVVGTDGATYPANFGTAGYYDKWIHIVGVAEENVSVRAYMDGELKDETAFPVGVRDAVDNLLVCCDHLYGRFAKGFITLARIYNRALSDAEVSDLYSIRRNIMEGCVLKLGSIGLVRGGGTQWLDEGPYKLHGTVYGAKRVRCCHCNPVVDYGV